MHHTPPQKQSEDESSDLWAARYVDKQQWDSHPDLPAAQKMHKEKELNWNCPHSFIGVGLNLLR